jgi:hypothetical protein
MQSINSIRRVPIDLAVKPEKQTNELNFSQVNINLETNARPPKITKSLPTNLS